MYTTTEKKITSSTEVKHNDINSTDLITSNTIKDYDTINENAEWCELVAQLIEEGVIDINSYFDPSWTKGE